MIDPNVEELLEQFYEDQVEGGHEATAESQADLVQAAADLGLIEPHGDAWSLTDTGREAARDVVRRHRLAERLLHDVLSVQDDRMEEGACEFEHILQHGLDERVCTLLGHPTTCPHGNPIPDGPCCRKARSDPIREVSSLADGDIGRGGVVAYLTTRERRDVQKLMAMSILPGARIRLLRRFPSYVFQVGYSQFTVDRSLAEVIYVHWLPEGPEAGPGRGRRHRRGAPRGCGQA